MFIKGKICISFFAKRTFDFSEHTEIFRMSINRQNQDHKNANNKRLWCAPVKIFKKHLCRHQPTKSGLDFLKLTSGKPRLFVRLSMVNFSLKQIHVTSLTCYQTKTQTFSKQ